MNLRTVHLGPWISAAVIAVVGCSSSDNNSGTGSPVVDGGSGGSDAGGAAGSSGGGKGGTAGSAGGSLGGGGSGQGGGGLGGKGGAATGGASDGGDVDATTNPIDGGDVDASTDSGNPGAGGAGAGGAGTGGTGTGGTGTGGTGTGGTGTGGTGTGGTGTGGVSSLDAGSDSGASHMRAFVTSGKWDGNLKTAGSGATGLEGGDKLCQAAADAESLGGTWIAWLSDSTTNAIDRIADVGPWYRIDGQKVFADKAGLMGTPLVALNISETGSTVNFLPWTGTKGDGTKAATNCSDWTTAAAGSASGECGTSNSTTGHAWTESADLPCSIPYNLYCFEQ